MKRLIRILIIVLLIPIVVVTAYISYLWLTYIDDTVVEGSAYGFQIGDSKLATYEKAIEALYDLSSTGYTAPYIDLKVSKELESSLSTRTDHTLLVQTLLHDVGYEKFSNLDTWEFYIDGSYFNAIKLKFCKESLCEIYRHRKYFELP